MNKIIKKLSIIIITFIVISSCIKDKVESNDNELITTMELRFMEQGSAAPVVFTFDDPDGPGGLAAVQEVISLEANKTYNLEIVLLDRTKNPVTIISDEVAEEGYDHRFYTIPSTASNITISNLDMDINNLPLGLNSTLNTGAVGNGKLRVVLRHYENGGKEATDPVDSEKSSTDVDIEFNVITHF